MTDTDKTGATNRTGSPRRRTHRRTLAIVLIPIAVMFGLVSYAPTLYQKFCAAFGAAGYVKRASATQASKAASTEAAARKSDTMEVTFDANVAQGLPWEFKPLQKKVTVKLGEQTKIYYYAKNNSDHTIVGRAVFNVTPYKAAPYFFKTQCFCFTKEKLGPGESAKLPVVFFVDPELGKDKYVNDVRQMALSYTFFPQKDQTPEQISKARDLTSGSKTEDQALATSQNTKFDNDAPKQ